MRLPNFARVADRSAFQWARAVSIIMGPDCEDDGCISEIGDEEADMGCLTDGSLGVEVEACDVDDALRHLEGHDSHRFCLPFLVAFSLEVVLVVTEPPLELDP